MTDEVFECLKYCVMQARYEHVKILEHLKNRARLAGFSEPTIKDAISAWARYERMDQK